jgi:lactoylglutathione lyase
MVVRARDLFEVHLTCGDLETAVAFYRDVIGFRLAHASRAPAAAFFWIGSRGKAMLGLWQGAPENAHITSHTAFRVSLADVLAAPATLRASGVTPLDFDGRPTELPVVLAWMPAAAVYFRDPHGNLLEYIAMLQDDPRPDDGVVSWAAWRITQTRARGRGSSRTQRRTGSRAADRAAPETRPGL